MDDASDVSVQSRQDQGQLGSDASGSSLAEAGTQQQVDAMRLLAAGVSLPHPGSPPHRL